MNNIIEDLKKITTISDSLFTGPNVKYISIWFNSEAAFTHKPEATGDITFRKDDLEGKKNFKGNNIQEILIQMKEFLEKLQNG